VHHLVTLSDAESRKVPRPTLNTAPLDNQTYSFE